MTPDTDMDGAWPLPGTPRHGAVWIGGALVLCERLDREPCPHDPTRRCDTCPGRPGAVTVNPAPHAAAPISPSPRVELLGPEPEEARPVAEFHAHPADWQYSITLLPGVPMLPDGTKLYAAPPARPVAPVTDGAMPSDPLHDDAYLRAVALGFPQGDARRWTLCRIADRIEAAIAASPAAPAPVALSEEQIAKHWPTPKTPDYAVVFARAAIAEFCRINGITAPSAAEGGPNARVQPP